MFAEGTLISAMWLAPQAGPARTPAVTATALASSQITGLRRSTMRLLSDMRASRSPAAVDGIANSAIPPHVLTARLRFVSIPRSGRTTDRAEPRRARAARAGGVRPDAPRDAAGLGD